ncbi:hypothetical protein [Nocardioides sp. OK12]|uniref:hypothetical protein n=1 Tax=Nocardioides sp. OK12 TaxID=2758661 RepID=UPI0021C463AC|nr:hypothetical protein [Nocardioides sp. OK12]
MSRLTRGVLASMAGATLMLVPSTSTTRAEWVDKAAVVGTASNATAVTLDLDCTPGLGGARISWPRVTSPTPLVYTATRHDGTGVLTPSIGSDGLGQVVLTSLFDGVSVSRTYNVDVTASLPGTSWKVTKRKTVTVVVIGLLVSC